MTNILNRLRSEPVLVTGALQALLGLLLAFGVPLTDEQVGAVLALSAAILAVVVRSKVSAVRGYTPKHRA